MYYNYYHHFTFLSGAVAISQPEEIDPYDLLDPVNMIDKMPKDFYERIVSNHFIYSSLIIVVNFFLFRLIQNGKREKKH